MKTKKRTKTVMVNCEWVDIKTFEVELGVIAKVPGETLSQALKCHEIELKNMYRTSKSAKREVHKNNEDFPHAKIKTYKATLILEEIR